jgi:hypothetical protein
MSQVGVATQMLLCRDVWFADSQLAFDELAKRSAIFMPLSSLWMGSIAEVEGP